MRFYLSLILLKRQDRQTAVHVHSDSVSAQYVPLKWNSSLLQEQVPGLPHLKQNSMTPLALEDPISQLMIYGGPGVPKVTAAAEAAAAAAAAAAKAAELQQQQR